MKTISLFNINFGKMSLEGVIDFIQENIKAGNGRRIQTVNVDHICLGYKNQNFKEIIDKSDLIVADGMPIVWYSKIFKNYLPQRITGVDLSYKLCELSNQKGFNIYLLGAQPEVVSKAFENMNRLYKDTSICGYYSPERTEIMDESLSKQIINKIKQCKTNVLLVAFGAPLQEEWLENYKKELNGIITIGVGGTFDFMSGRIKRAPKIFQICGLEWMFRFLQQPGRMFNRYFIQDSRFVLICFTDLFNRLKGKSYER